MKIPQEDLVETLSTAELHISSVFFPLWERVAANQFPAYLKVTVEHSNKKGQKLA